MISAVEPLLVPIIESAGAMLYDLEYIKEGSDKILRVYIDKDGGVDLNDCEKVSRAIEAVLDEQDLIKERYRLQVGSPGVERSLSRPWHFERYVGHEIMLRLYAPLASDDGVKRKKFTGKLEAYENGKIVLTDTNGAQWAFDIKDVSKCQLVVFKD